LPSCPYCLERLDVTVTGIITGKHGWLEMPSGSNRANWCACCEKMLMPAATMKCEQCEAMHTREAPMWVCLVCGHVGCGRYTKAACAKHHALETGHSLCVEVSSGRIWDYERDAFVHRRL
ncbi:brca1-associated protein, putative, partial [Perkinsus marinus ATCC 50983]